MMKGLVKKIISIIQVFIITVTIIMPSFAVMVKEAKASGRTSLTINLPGKSSFGVQFGENLSKDLTIVTESTNGAYTRNGYNDIYIDKGLSIWSYPTDNWGDFWTEVYAGRIEGEVDASKALFKVISKKGMNFNDYSEDCFTIVTKRNRSLYMVDWVEEVGRAYIHIRDFSVTLDSNNAGVDQYGLICNTAIIDNNTLYVAPGTETTLVARRVNNSTPDDKGTFVFEGGIGTVTDNKITIKSSTQVGKTGTIKWENVNGSSASINVVVSNFSDGSMSLESRYNTTINYGKNYFNYNGNLIEVSKSLYTSKNGSVLFVYPNKYFESKEIALSLLEIVDTTSCIDGDIKIEKDKDHYIVTFDAVSNGILNVKFKNYKGNVYEENWYIGCSDGESVQHQLIPTTGTNGSDIINEDNKEEETKPEKNDGANTGTTTPESGTVVKPTINCSATKTESGIVKIDVTTKNATAVKYLIKERTTEDYVNPVLKNSKYSSYTSSNGWKEVTTPNKFSVNINPHVLGSGKYDITILAKNSKDEVISYTGYGAHFVNAAPISGIIETTQLAKSTSRTYSIYASSTDKDTIKSWYYVQYKESKSEYTKPSVDVIESQGKLFTGSTQLKLDRANNYESGFYDVTIYSEDEYGATNISYVSNIGITNVPTVKYTIKGETGNSEAGYTCTTQKSDKQTVTIEVNDIDENDILNVWYYVSENPNIDTSSSQNFYQGGNVQYKQIKSNKGSFDVEVTSEKGKTKSKYVYWLVQDNVGGITTGRTGEIQVDGTALELIGITSEQLESNSSVGLAVGEKLKVTCTFNHTMAKDCPDLYLNFGNSKRKQDDIECDGNLVTYVYKITENDTNGYVSISNFDFSNKVFTDDYSVKNTYSKQIGEAEIINMIGTKQFYVDTIKPTIESLEIAYTTNENSVIDDTNKDVYYISGIDNAELKIKYSEQVIGNPVLTSIVKDNNYGIQISTKTGTKDLRYEDIYNFTYDHKTTLRNFEGVYEFTGFGYNMNLTDKAGNKVDLNKYNVKYTLNGKDLGNTKVILDDKVSQSKMLLNNENANNNDVCSVGTKVTCFAEYKNENEQDYKDESGITKIVLQVFMDDNNRDKEIILKDKNDNIVESKDTEYYFEYELNEEQLPVSFVTENVGKYRVFAQKEDKLGNTTKTLIDLQVKNAISKSEKSGINIENKDEMRNYNTLTDAEKEYTLYFELTDLEKEDINVILVDAQNDKVDIQHAGQVEIDNKIYESYKFKINKSQKYTLKIANAEFTEVVYSDIIEIDNVYRPGDADGDGEYTPLDASYMLRYLAGIINDKRVAYAIDINNDGKAIISDVILYNRFIAEDPGITIIEGGYLKQK